MPTRLEMELKEAELRTELKNAVKDLHSAIKRVSKACKRLESSRKKLDKHNNLVTCGCEICPFSDDGLTCRLSSENTPMCWDTRTLDITKVGNIY